MMRGLERLLVIVTMLVGLSTVLAACGDTWQGVKKDTGENIEKTGEAIDKAGEKVQQ